MIDTTLQLSRVRCNAESDFGDAEPYLWTVFFYSDLSTLSGSAGLIRVHTPHRGSTTRGMYADGVAPGDLLAIPPDMGTHEVALDDGGLGLSLLGCLFVLIDERNTDADAIKAGHLALDESVRLALNQLAARKITAPDKTPTAHEVKDLSDFVGERVLAAIKTALSWWDLLDQQDRFVGSGFKVFSEAQLQAVSSQGGVETFEVNIHTERQLAAAGQPPRVLIDDYDVLGTLRAQASAAPAPFDGPARDRFVQAVGSFQKVQTALDELEKDIASAQADGQRVASIARRRRMRRFDLAAARRALSASSAAWSATLPGHSPIDQTTLHHLCVEPDCCAEYAHQVHADCMARTGLGDAYCTELARYRYAQCRHPNALTPLAPPLAPAARI